MYSRSPPHLLHHPAHRAGGFRICHDAPFSRVSWSAVHSGANIAGLKTNQSAVVFGMGAVSLPPGARSEPRACGVIAVDIVLSRVEFAEAYAAMDTYVPPKFQRNAKLKMQQLGLEERGPTAIDLIVEASGAEVFIQTSILLLCSGTCARTVTRGGGSALPPLTHTLDMQLGMGQAE